MIVLDTSALMAIVLDDTGAEACAAVLEAEQHCLISAATLAETLIVAERREVAVEIASLLEGLAIEVVPVTAVSASAVAAAYSRFGKGVHLAGLNFGDCFAYALARERDCPLLFVGEDFRRTDIAAAISP